MNRITHQFVEFIPEKLAEGVIFVSTSYCVASHLCCCGCGKEVVTPIAPNEWSVTFYGESVTLHPSIGNWRFPCRSHYWIRKNRVEWVPELEDDDRSDLTCSKSQVFQRPLWQRLLEMVNALARRLIVGENRPRR